MDYPTYSLRPAGIGADAYRQAVAELANEVVALGEPLRPTVEAYAYFIDETLIIGVLWRARGHEAMAAAQAPIVQ